MGYLPVGVYSAEAQTARRRLTRAEVDVVSSHPHGSNVPVFWVPRLRPAPIKFYETVLLKCGSHLFKVKLDYN